jgi:hypothetical protein
MIERDTNLGAWLAIIESEYQEMPGLLLTKAQARRLWGLTASDCDALLETLQATHFLRVTDDGQYVRADYVGPCVDTHAH